MTESLGRQGEDWAAAYLRRRGIDVVESHFQTRWGEIDLIGRQGDTWIFVEVKTRTRQALPSAADAITPAKQKKLVNAALSYMKKNRLEGENMRFDALLIEAGRVEWIAGAFDASASPYRF
ncbi:MAG TPA: YraN family protein [Elusimicrobiota bacterium]|nr:YraN family protein [Elusimicrobiota bacterium]